MVVGEVDDVEIACAVDGERGPSVIVMGVTDGDGGRPLPVASIAASNPDPETLRG
jgi:hypothetical protein